MTICDQCGCESDRVCVGREPGIRIETRVLLRVFCTHACMLAYINENPHIFDDKVSDKFVP